jgi:monothiol glutaredoxin
MSEKDEILGQIKKVVQTHPVVLFMKGTPSFPQCGFSARVVQVLQSYEKPFKAYDVLSNPLLREAIKEFSNWPTIPQVYIKGEFVGGSDILVEMHQSGELAELMETVPEEAATT